MGGGPSTQPSQQISGAQQATAAEALRFGEQQYAQQQTDQAPLRGFLTSLTSGNQDSINTAFAPYAANIDRGFQSSKDQIYNSTPAGAGRDFALAELPVQQQSAKSSALNSMILQAFPTLANLGSSSGNEALQFFGANLSGLSGASNTQNNIMQAQSASKASTMGFLGSLAGAGGMALGGKKA